MTADHFHDAKPVCDPHDHDYDRGHGIGKCRICRRWTMTVDEYRRQRRHGYAGPNGDGTYWALIPARLGGGLASRVDLDG